MTYRTKTHIGFYRNLTISHLERFEMHTKCALRSTKNVHLISAYSIDYQSIAKSSVRKCAGKIQAKKPLCRQ
jgi:hypothetical protein